jgi:hypothetical protein
MNYDLKNLHKIGPVYLILLTMLVWNISNVYYFIKKYSDEYNINKSDTDYKFKRMIIIRQNYNLLEKCIILAFEFALIISIILFITGLSLTIAYILNKDDSEINSANRDEQNRTIKIVTIVAFLLYILGSVYNLGNLLLHPLFYSIEKKFFTSPIKPHYYKLMFIPNESPYLCEIKELYTIEKIDENEKKEHHDIENAKTDDIDYNEDEAVLTKDKEKEEIE